MRHLILFVETVVKIPRRDRRRRSQLANADCFWEPSLGLRISRGSSQTISILDLPCDCLSAEYARANDAEDSAIFLRVHFRHVVLDLKKGIGRDFHTPKRRMRHHRLFVAEIEHEQGAVRLA